MKKIKQHLLIEDIYTSCISNFQSKSKTKLFEDFQNDFIRKSNEYEEKAVQNQLHNSMKHEIIGNFTKEELIKLYNNKLAKTGQPAYKYYNEILSIAPNGICPYCNQVVASTLDHFLPKASYPLFAITPLNLIPACKDCNTGKGEPEISTNDDLHLHPYFDEIESYDWLKGEVINIGYPLFRFKVSENPSWDKSLKSRVKNHFKVFEIGRLYSTHAAKELSNLRYLRQIKIKNGKEELVQHIKMIHKSCERNSWKSAMLESMLNSEWFLEEGVELIK